MRTWSGRGRLRFAARPAIVLAGGGVALSGAALAAAALLCTSFGQAQVGQVTATGSTSWPRRRPRRLRPSSTSS